MDEALGYILGVATVVAVITILALMGGCESNHPVLTPLPTGSTTTVTVAGLRDLQDAHEQGRLPAWRVDREQFGGEPGRADQLR